MLKLGVFLLLGASALLCAADTTDWIASLGGQVQRDAAGNVVALNFRGAWVNDVEMVDVARLSHLQRLDLSHTRITDEGMLHLKPAAQIEDLNLYYAEWVTDQGLTAIRNWKKLKRLNLRGTRIANGTLEILSHMPQLESLDVGNTHITDNGLDLLITLTNLKELSVGQIANDGHSDVVRGGEPLAFLRMLPALTYLDLSGARPVSPDMGGRRPASLPVMPQSTILALAELKNLRTLKLGFSGIAAADLKTLRTLASVEKLGLEECPRVDDLALAELANWKSLKYLDVQATKVTAAGVEALRKVKPGLVVLTAAPEPPRPPASRKKQ